MITRRALGREKQAKTVIPNAVRASPKYVRFGGAYATNKRPNRCLKGEQMPQDGSRSGRPRADSRTPASPRWAIVRARQHSRTQTDIDASATTGSISPEDSLAPRCSHRGCARCPRHNGGSPPHAPGRRRRSGVTRSHSCSLCGLDPSYLGCRRPPPDSHHQKAP